MSEPISDDNQALYNPQQRLRKKIKKLRLLESEYFYSFQIEGQNDLRDCKRVDIVGDLCIWDNTNGILTTKSADILNIPDNLRPAYRVMLYENAFLFIRRVCEFDALSSLSRNSSMRRYTRPCLNKSIELVYQGCPEFSVQRLPIQVTRPAALYWNEDYGYFYEQGGKDAGFYVLAAGGAGCGSPPELGCLLAFPFDQGIPNDALLFTRKNGFARYPAFADEDLLAPPRAARRIYRPSTPDARESILRWVKPSDAEWKDDDVNGWERDNVLIFPLSRIFNN